jgi:Tol biopolymer transport system component
MPDNNKRGLSRRNLFSLTGGVALAPLAAAIPARSAGQPADADTHVTIAKGTNIAPTVSPDGKSIAFDLLGVLWLVDIGGGPARRLSDDFGDVAMPDWSPDGKTLVFQSYRNGSFQLWSCARDGGGLKQLTSGPFDCREPRVSPDGKTVAFSSDRTGSYGLHLLDLASGAISTLVDTAAEEYEPAWSPDGGSIAFTTNKSKIEVVELATGGRRVVGSIAVSADPLAPTEVRSPAFTADGKVIYALLTTGVCQLMLEGMPFLSGEDVFPFRVSWLSKDEYVYAADGELRRRRIGGPAQTIPFTATVPVAKTSYVRRKTRYDDYTTKPVIGIGSPMLSPDGKTVAFRALNDIYLMPIGGKPVPLTGDGFLKSDPAFSPDGRWLSYSTDRGGKLDIWLRELATGQDRQLTHLPDAAVSGSWSRDGTLIAFLDQNGQVYTVEVATGAVQKIHGPLWEPGRPTFSPDSNVVALAAFKPYSARFREGLSEILTIDRTTGEAAYAAIAPHRGFGTRGDDGPHWSPDGKTIAYVFASTLWTAPVDGKGRITGPATKLNAEVTDSPSWSGDSASILYLSNGKLRLISTAGGTPRTVPMPLTYAQARPPGRTVIRLGGLWAGKGPEVMRDVDVTIVDGKIASIAPHGGKAPPNGVKFVDASKLFAIPGLIDIHNHRQMQGYSYGDRTGRLWLSFGVTTTRSPGSPAYHGVEEREALATGARIGPRYFTTGEAIDGSRIYYNFMRPVTEEGQLELELSRAEALGYDMLKSYVRAPLQQQKLVAEWGHRRGIPTSSHYHYPALRFGLDQMEHLGATNRFGYSRTIAQSGAGYEDVISLFVHSGARRTPTLFQSAPMLAEDPNLADDPRILALYPAWERAKLIARTAAAKAGDPAAQTVLKRCVEQIRDTLRSGGKITAGTDSPIDLNCISLHMNLRGMCKYGISPYEALLTATRFNGEFLEAPIGVLEPGAMADLAIVDGDPLRRIEDAAKVRMTVLGGRIHTIDELTAPFAKTARAEEDHRHNRMLPPLRMASANAAFWWHDADYVESGRHACCADVYTLGLFRKAPPERRTFRAVEVS